MDPNRALSLARNGGTILCLDVPVGTEVGIDCLTFQTGSFFQGIKMIPPGIHILYTAAKENAVRTSIFLNITPGSVHVFRWDKFHEALMTLKGAAASARLHRHQQHQKQQEEHNREQTTMMTSLQEDETSVGVGEVEDQMKEGNTDSTYKAHAQGEFRRRNTGSPSSASSSSISSSSSSTSSSSSLIDPEDEEAAYIAGAKKMQFDRSLGPYPLDQLGRWKVLSSHITEETVNRIKPRRVTLTASQKESKEQLTMMMLEENRNNLASSPLRVFGDDLEDGFITADTDTAFMASTLQSLHEYTKSASSNAGVASSSSSITCTSSSSVSSSPNTLKQPANRFFAPSRTLMFSVIAGCGAGSIPSHRTLYAMDTSYSLVALTCSLLRKSTSALTSSSILPTSRAATAAFSGSEVDIPLQIIGELQIAFILFLCGQSFASLEQWKRLVDMICRAEDVLLRTYTPEKAVEDSIHRTNHFSSAPSLTQTAATTAMTTTTETAAISLETASAAIRILSRGRGGNMGNTSTSSSTTSVIGGGFFADCFAVLRAQISALPPDLLLGGDIVDGGGAGTVHGAGDTGNSRKVSGKPSSSSSLLNTSSSSSSSHSFLVNSLRCLTRTLKTGKSMLMEREAKMEETGMEMTNTNDNNNDKNSVKNIEYGSRMNTTSTTGSHMSHTSFTLPTTSTTTSSAKIPLITQAGVEIEVKKLLSLCKETFGWEPIIEPGTAHISPEVVVAATTLVMQERKYNDVEPRSLLQGGVGTTDKEITLPTDNLQARSSQGHIKDAYSRSSSMNLADEEGKEGKTKAFSFVANKSRVEDLDDTDNDGAHDRITSTTSFSQAPSWSSSSSSSSSSAAAAPRSKQYRNLRTSRNDSSIGNNNEDSEDNYRVNIKKKSYDVSRTLAAPIPDEGTVDGTAASSGRRVDSARVPPKTQVDMQEIPAVSAEGPGVSSDEDEVEQEDNDEDEELVVLNASRGNATGLRKSSVKKPSISEEVEAKQGQQMQRGKVNAEYATMADLLAALAIDGGDGDLPEIVGYAEDDLI